MERYFFEAGQFEQSVKTFDENGEPDEAYVYAEGYDIFDRKRGMADPANRIAWTADVDVAQQVVDALNKALQP